MSFLDQLKDFAGDGLKVYRDEREADRREDLAKIDLQSKLIEQRLAGLEPALDENPNASPTRSINTLIPSNGLLLIGAAVAGVVLLKMAKVI